MSIHDQPWKASGNTEAGDEVMETLPVSAVLRIEALQRAFQPQTGQDGRHTFIGADQAYHVLIVFLNDEVKMCIEQGDTGGYSPVSWSC